MNGLAISTLKCTGFAFVAVLAGCDLLAPRVDSSREVASSITTLNIEMSAPIPAAPAPADPKATPRFVYQLQVFQLAVPQRSISDNSDFWKSLDEQAMGFEVHSLLGKNGIRLGVAPKSDMQRVEPFLSDADATVQRMVGTAAQNVRMEMRTNIDQQTLFWINRAGEQIGRDFEKVDNIVFLSFRQMPRNPDKVRISFAPAVRSRIQKFQVGPRGGERIVEVVNEQTLFDLGIDVELNVNQYMVIAPSTISDVSMSVGRQFLMKETPSGLRERVIVIVPSVIRIAEDSPSP